ncbi:hypothetical protein IWW51_000501, partial [Coemansia sp. RSA 2702]
RAEVGDCERFVCWPLRGRPAPDVPYAGDRRHCSPVHARARGDAGAAAGGHARRGRRAADCADSGSPPERQHRPGERHAAAAPGNHRSRAVRVAGKVVGQDQCAYEHVIRNPWL